MPNEPATQLTKSDRIAERIRPEIASETSISKGVMAFRNIEQIMEFGKVMSIASVAIPKHLRDNPGACLAVAIQASEWEMSPFSVANKTYVVNDRLAYEAQLINAVILKRAPIIGRFEIEFTGDGDERQCTVRAKVKDGDKVEYTSPKISKIPVKNSPLWKGDPDQQLFYYSSRAMCRRHFPDVILGIYAPDEIEELKMVEGTVLPTNGTASPDIKFGPALPEPAATPETPNEPPKRKRRTREEMAADAKTNEAQPVAPESPADPGPFNTNPDPAPEPETPLAVLRKKFAEHNIDETRFQRFLIMEGYIEPSDKLERLPNSRTQEMVDSFESVLPAFLETQPK